MRFIGEDDKMKRMKRVGFEGRQKKFTTTTELKGGRTGEVDDA